MSSLLIQSVNLTNYKTFATKFVEFKRGINLLVGENGAGKSTIIEAIAYSMYDANIKRFKKKDYFIKIGEKKAKIEVVFTGVDGIEYRVERVIGTHSKHQLFQNGAMVSICEDSNLVIEKIGELTGIKENGKTIFENIIFAGQNKITEIFMMRNTDRVKLFNNIFNLGIYQDMWNSSLKDSNRKLEDIVTGQKSVLENISESIEDSKELSAELKTVTAEKESVEKELKEVETLRDEQKATIDTIEKKVADKNGLTKNLEAENSRLIENRDSIKREESFIEQTTKAKAIVESNEGSYKEFLVFQEQSQIITNQIKELESFASYLAEKQKELNRTEIEKQQMVSDYAVIEAKVKDIEAQIIEVKAQVDIDGKALADEKLLLDQIIEDGKQAAKLTKICKEFTVQIEQKQTEKTELKHKIEFLKNSITVIEADKEKRLKNEITAIIENQQKREELQSSIHKLQSRLEELQAAQIELSEGFCPILKENCKNIELTSDSDYFSKRENKLQAEKSMLENAMTEFAGINEQLISKKSELATLQKRVQENGAKERDIKESTLTIENIDKDIKIAEMELKPILEKHGFTGENIYEEVEKIAAQVTSLREEYNTKNGFYKTNVDRFTKLEEKLKNLENTNQKEMKKQTSLVEKINEFSHQVNEIKAVITDLETKAEPLSKAKDKKEQLDKQILKLQPAYNLYMTNIEQSKSLESHRETLLRLNKNSEKIEEGITSLKTSIEVLDKELSQIDITKLQEELSQTIAIYNEKNNIFQQANESFIKVQHRVSENEKRIAEKTKLENELKKDLKRVEIGESFRKMVKNLGVKVSERYLLSISVDASAKFNEITGRNEKIEWREGYELLLVNSGNDKRAFTQLSGGEQVAVAISVRAALLKQLSSAQFAFFDEPTNNLDIERKELLAQSIDKIMSGLNQVFIVTHDDNFETMAEWIVEV